jgi:hypothetical protein
MIRFSTFSLPFVFSFILVLSEPTQTLGGSFFLGPLLHFL